MSRSLNAYKNAIKQEQDELVVSYFPAVKAMAYRLKERLPASIDVADLISIGIEEMIKLSRKYDKNQNDNFWGYARKRVNGSMLDYLRSLDTISRNNRKIIKDIDVLIDEYFNEFEEIPDDNYLAQKLELDIEKVRQARVSHSVSYVLPLDEQMQLYDEENTLEKIEKENMMLKIEGILSTLNEREQTIVQLYYFEELNFKEISDILGISQSRICQILQQVLKILRKGIGNG